MKVIQIEQNSEEWLEFRKGKSGGSEFGNLYVTGLPLVGVMKKELDTNGVEYPKAAKAADLAALLTPAQIAKLKIQADRKQRYYEMIAEKVARPITPNDYTDKLNGQPFSMMARGHILEPEAAEAFSTKTGKKLIGDVVWVSDDDDNIYISPDRCVANDNGTLPEKITEAVEIKCLGSAEIIKAFLTNSYPKEYRAQFLKYFVVNDDLQTLYIALYTDVIPELELQIFTITRNEVADAIAEAREFEKAIMADVERDAQRIAELGF